MPILLFFVDYKTMMRKHATWSYPWKCLETWNICSNSVGSWGISCLYRRKFSAN